VLSNVRPVVGNTPIARVDKVEPINLGGITGVLNESLKVQVKMAGTLDKILVAVNGNKRKVTEQPKTANNKITTPKSVVGLDG